MSVRKLTDDLSADSARIIRGTGSGRRPGTAVAQELPEAHAGAHGGVRLAGAAALPGAPKRVRDVHGIDEALTRLPFRQ